MFTPSLLSSSAVEWAVVLAMLAAASAAIILKTMAYFRRRSGCVCSGHPGGCPAGRAMAALDEADQKAPGKNHPA